MVVSYCACVSFVDDVRFEQNGKIIAVGMYDSELRVENISETNPLKIYALVRVIGPVDASNDTPVMGVWINDNRLANFRLSEDDESLYRRSLSDYRYIYSDLLKKHGQDKYSYVANAVVPIEIGSMTETSVLYIVVTIGEIEIPAGSIVIDLGSHTPENQTPSAS